ncbi:MAG TPA: hypothetical protein VGK99_11905 [Acidobacteriota bacterium]|jgi:hypothetical protein
MSGFFTKRLATLFIAGIALTGSSSYLRAETYIIPHFAAGRILESGTVDSRYASRFSVVNLGSSDTSVTIDAFDSTGTRLTIVTFGPTKVTPQGMGQYFLDSPELLVTGWLRITTSQPAAVRGSIIFLQIDTLDIQPLSAFPAMAYANTDSNPGENFISAVVPVALYEAGSTGIALAFPSSGGAEAVVALTLRDSEGKVLGDKTIRIPANGYKSFLIEDLLPQIRSSKTGVLTLSTIATPIYGVAIEFQARPFWMRTIEMSKR